MLNMTMRSLSRGGPLVGAALLLVTGLLSSIGTAWAAAHQRRTVPGGHPADFDPLITPDPGAHRQALTVERVATDRYPRLTVRFTVNPIQGASPSYLEQRDVAIVEGGIVDTPDEVYTVGQVPTSGSGTYEAVSQAHAKVSSRRRRRREAGGESPQPA